MSPAAHILRGLITAYRWTVSPILGVNCRFLPTCSDYAAEAVGTHGALRGGWLALGRMLRCHPFAKAGYDPVPHRRGGGASPGGGALPNRADPQHDELAQQSK